MPTYLEGLGQQAGSAAVGGLMGLFLQGYNDERQTRQQEALQNLQIKGQKEMTDYNMEKQLQMWEATNFPAQLAMMKKAGLSPGLMYGKGGAGGTTTGNASGSVQGASAPVGGNEIQTMIGLGMQKELQMAQIENLKAQTNKTNTEAEKIGGVDTGLVRTQILDLTVGIDNKRAAADLTRIQTRLGEIEAEVKGRTIEDSVRYIGWAAEKTMQEMTDWRYKNNINEETWQNKIKQVEAELIGTWLRNALTQSQTRKTDTEIEAIVRKGVQDWTALDIQRQNADQQGSNMRHQQWINDVQKSTEIPMKILEQAVEGVMRRGQGMKNTYREGSNNKGDYWEHTQHY